ncbi:MAG: polyketide synthase dehydratase domain-containing protein, partial [Ktedonobacteraceae bacterium]|nr:polyketide synthase dehydratase domain-containing protein [Ktedonobacteraceae bacterium]
RDRDDWEVLLQTVSALYIKGINLDWQGFDRDYARRRLSALPTYPFERQRCWLDPKEEKRVNGRHAEQIAQHALVEPGRAGRHTESQDREQVPNGPVRHPLLDSHTALVYPVGIHVWEATLDKQRQRYLGGHRIQGVMAVPISVYLEMVHAAASEALGPGPHTLKDIALQKLLLLPERGDQRIQVVFSTDNERQITFQVYSHATGMPDQPRDQWALHVSGKLQRN